MISFIIIGRNEGWKLKKCILSVITTIQVNKLQKYDIIYVDSKSSDNSIEIAKEFKQVKVYKITGDTNAAIARNIGASEAKGEYFFFIDGDMEILNNFLPMVYSEGKGLAKDYISGNWMNYIYNAEGILIGKEKFLEMEKDAIEKTTGGLFLIRKDIWNSIGGMKNEFRRSQDIDLGLRLAKKQIFLLRKKEIAANHHTMAYLNKKRMWDDFFSWDHLFAKSLLYRTHIFNSHLYYRLFRSDYTLILGIVALFLLLISNTLALVVFIFYAILIFIKSKLNLYKVLYYFLRDLSVFIGFFVFYPQKKFVISYNKK